MVDLGWLCHIRMNTRLMRSKSPSRSPVKESLLVRNEDWSTSHISFEEGLLGGGHIALVVWLSNQLSDLTRWTSIVRTILALISKMDSARDTTREKKNNKSYLNSTRLG